jgi:hypothetical protein
MARKASTKTSLPAALTILDKFFVVILLVIFAGVVLHAPLSVAFGSLFPSAELLIKSWKEILMVAAGIALAVILHREKRWAILKQPIIFVIAGYALLHLLLVPVFWQGGESTIAGLMMDLRYLLFFVLVYAAICMYPTLRRTFIVTFFVGAFVVSIFALLQVSVLPNDVLKYIGYNNSTIAPYLTVDDNPEYVRINSTLRGPNPLGAYVVIVLALLFALWLRVKQVLPQQRQRYIMTAIALGSFVALWASYSRSALIAAFVALGIIVMVTVGKQFSRKVWVGIAVGVLVIAGGLFVGRDSNFVSNVILHDNAETGAEITSNDGHADSLIDGLERMARQPLGGGVGSTGSASLYSAEQPLIIENQYLFIAHEAGWIGFIAFLYILWLAFRGLWRRRSDWMALAVFASGIGLALIGILLPVWVDDTVAIIWWGLAAVVLAGKEPDGRTIYKKTKRAA